MVFTLSKLILLLANMKRIILCERMKSEDIQRIILNAVNIKRSAINCKEVRFHTVFYVQLLYCAIDFTNVQYSEIGFSTLGLRITKTVLFKLANPQRFFS